MDNSDFITIKQGDTVISNKYTEKEFLKMKLRLGLVAAVAFALVLLFTFYNIRIAYTASGSMVPTISVGDLVVYTKVNTNHLSRGDIVLFNPVTESNEGSFLTGREEFYEKRIIGLPGESIRIENGTVFINNEPLDEPYTVFSDNSSFMPYRNMDEMVIPNGCYFMMGDNRDNSFDSRGFGVIPAENIKYVYVFSMPSLAGFLTGTNNDQLWLS